MKTRIKIIEYGDGRKEYIPQVKYSFREYFLRHFRESQGKNEELGLILIFPIFISVVFISHFFWYNSIYLAVGNNCLSMQYKYVFDNEEEAKSAIDSYLIIRAAKIDAQNKKKLSEKVIKQTHIDYP